MSQSTRVCRFEDVPDRGATAARVDSATGGFDLVVLREGDAVYAYHNECPHAGRNLDYVPGRFLVKDSRLVCAVHGATFAVASGACVGGPCRNGLVAIPIVVSEGWVELKS